MPRVTVGDHDAGRHFPPNGYGLPDLIGNVWEWTADRYAPRHEADAPKACCIPQDPAWRAAGKATTRASAGKPNILFITGDGYGLWQRPGR